MTSLELNHKPLEKAVKGQEVCIKIEPTSGETPKMFGRHFDHTDMLVSRVSILCLRTLCVLICKVAGAANVSIDNFIFFLNMLGNIELNIHTNNLAALMLYFIMRNPPDFLETLMMFP